MNRHFLPRLAPTFVFLACFQLGDRPQDSSAAEPRTGDTQFAASDWPWWRGQQRDGVGAMSQKPPLRWSAAEHVLWKTAVPGRGHASPTIVGNLIFLATADEQTEVQSVLCYDRGNGRQLWKADVHTGGLERKGHPKSSQASATVACDGEHLYANFLHNGGIYTTALNLDGKQLWQTRVSDFVTHQGFGSSPAIYRSLVIVTTDHKGGGVVAALDRATGKFVWQQERPKLPNYMSPTILSVAGRDQLLIGGCDLIASFDPISGKRLWQIEGSTTECVGTMVTDGQLVFVSGGYPKKLTVAVKADGSGEVVWQNSVQTYVPSMLVHGGHLYTVTDSGVATCWKSSTGEELWKARLGGTFNASPVLIGDLIFATNQEGKTFIFRANPAEYQLLAENQLGEDVYATPVICAGRIYLRVAERSSSGARQEWLYCVGEDA